MVKALFTVALLAFLLVLATGSWVALLVSAGFITLAAVALFCLGCFSRWPLPR